MNSFSIFCGIIIFLFSVWGCEKLDNSDINKTELAVKSIEKPAIQEINDPLVEIDLDQIKERGKLTALTHYNANSYFIYKGEPLGFEYELLELLAKHLGVELEIVVVSNLDQIFNSLNKGIGDIIAYNLTITKARRTKVSFTDYHTDICQVLVQRLPEKWREMKRHEIEKMLIRNPIELIGKKVHVRKESSYYPRLVNLSDEIGEDIDIVEVPGDVPTDELIRKVALGEIEYTVADENLALVNQAYYSNIDIYTEISFPQRLAWAVRKNSPLLQEAVNLWLKEIKQKPTFNIIYNKYYQDKRYFQQRAGSEYFSQSGDRDKISPFDDIIKSEAQKIDWDWRILASQIYQESQFDPKAKSWAGAKGLMQLMPRTAREFGAKKVYNPTENVAAGVSYLRWLEEYWQEIPDSLERIKFILASYNAGQGHVQDARRLAQKYNKDPNLWENNVAEFILKKSQEKYYMDEVAQFGYCRGEEPVNYVAEIFDRYDHYQQIIKN